MKYFNIPVSSPQNGALLYLPCVSLPRPMVKFRELPSIGNLMGKL